jgi:sulfur relay (sulfurtransferase) DsrC/TusE family protein
MSSANVISTPELFDEDGLIRDFASWSESLGETLAQNAGIGQLTGSAMTRVSSDSR